MNKFVLSNNIQKNLSQTKINTLKEIANTLIISDNNCKKTELIEKIQKKSNELTITDLKNYKLYRNDISESFITDLIHFNEEWKQYKSDTQKYLNNIDTILNKSVYGMKEAKLEIKRVIAQWISTLR